jgi:sugar/nucleoside kinase (ribokinase family)
MGRKLRALAAFVYDLVIGDDWRMALGLAAAVAVTVALSRTTFPSWWVLPTAILLLLPLSVWRTARRRA